MVFSFTELDLQCYTHTLMPIGLGMWMTARHRLHTSVFWDLIPFHGHPKNREQLHVPQRRLNTRHWPMWPQKQFGCPLFLKNLYFQSKTLLCCYVTILEPCTSASIRWTIRAWNIFKLISTLYTIWCNKEVFRLNMYTHKTNSLIC
jgi:hypothetical protein